MREVATILGVCGISGSGILFPCAMAGAFGLVCYEFVKVMNSFDVLFNHVGL